MKKALIVSILMIVLVFGGCVLEKQQPLDTIKPQKDMQEHVDTQQVHTTVVIEDTPLELGSFEEPDTDISKPVTTKTFDSEDAYLAFVKRYGGSGNEYYGGFNGIGMVRTAMMADDAVMEMAVAESAPSAAVAKGADLDFSETNVQVQGVDEADILKTDGEYIYTVTDNTLFIIKAYPGDDAEVVSTIDFDNNRPSGLFIQGNQLAVFGNFYDVDFFKEIDFRPRHGMTFFTVYDISDKEDPEVVKEYKFEGSYFNARMIEEHVYFVVRNQPEYRIDYPTPLIVEDTAVRSMPVSDMYFYDFPYRSPQFVTVHALNLEDVSEDVESASVAVEYGQNLYMSHNNMYITYTEYVNEWELQQEITKELLEPYLTKSDKKLIEKIKATDNDVLSHYEKKNRIMQIYFSYQQYLDSDEQEELQEKAEKKLKQLLEEYEHFEYTVINKIGIKDGSVTVKENGKVPGHIINQFSLDEYEGVLRIATTINQRWDRFGKERTESSNNVYTLDEDLEILGDLEGLAKTEQIYSARFIGDRLYMVTFRQIDPFFVIDLSDPTDPDVLGELKIPGFSRYLHPYDENTIIGIGQDATEEGRTQGLKISLFDVSDVGNPDEVAKYVTQEKYAQSTALYEHKAFLFSKEKNLLVIPAYSYDYRGRQKGYNGAFVFDIDKDDIELRGLIDHSDGGDTRYYYQPMVERSLYIEELLYTKSPNLLRINELDDLDSVENVKLRAKQGTDIPIY